MNGTFCHCNNCPGNEYDDESGVCYLKLGGQCFSAVEETYNGEIIRDFGCISAEDQALLQCKGDLVPSYYPRSIKCCNYTDLCNKYLIPRLKPRTTIPPTTIEYKFYFAILLVCITVAFFLFLAYKIAYVCYVTKKKERSRDNFIVLYSLKRKSRNVISNYISTSSSAVGKPLLSRTSISRQIDRRFSLGCGRFTEVNLVNWSANRIIEKVFRSGCEQFWSNEKRVYETALMRHDNILVYISSDILKSGLKAIYTDYHELGSLNKYLDKICLNYTDFVRLVRSAAAGIAHLHTEILGTPKRPAVAHCDITSNNFLVNKGKECVISNFGISVMHISINKKLEYESDFTYATPRYMAPEVAIATVMKSSFEALKMADIYSLGLVFFEICQRCATIEGNRFTLEEHTLPFSNVLPRNPTTIDMKKLYSERKVKDILSIPARWENDHKVLRPFLNSVLRDCLNQNPASRLTALRVKKNIESLENSDLRNIEIL